MRNLMLSAGVLSLALLGGCADMSEGGGASTGTGASPEAFAAAMADAKAEYSKAEEAGYAWRDTKDLMDKADEAMKAGDAEKAMKLVGQAKRQSEHALAQAEREKNAGPNF